MSIFAQKLRMSNRLSLNEQSSLKYAFFFKKKILISFFLISIETLFITIKLDYFIWYGVTCFECFLNVAFSYL